MEIISIAGTKTTPSINFDFSWCRLEIKGVSIAEHPSEFYQPLLDAIKRYLLKPRGVTTISFSLVYFNSSSARIILHIIAVFKEKLNSPGQLVINWYYDKWDEDLLETVKDIESLSRIKFNFFPVEREP